MDSNTTARLKGIETVPALSALVTGCDSNTTARLKLSDLQNARSPARGGGAEELL